MDQVGVVAGPGVVDQARTGRAGVLGDLGAPGVDRQDHTGVTLANGGDEADHPVDLLLGGHVVAGAGLDPADVQDLGPGGDGLVDRGEGHVVVQLPGPGEERVGGAVDDGHHHGATGCERARPESHPRDGRGLTAAVHGVRVTRGEAPARADGDAVTDRHRGGAIVTWAKHQRPGDVMR